MKRFVLMLIVVGACSGGSRSKHAPPAPTVPPLGWEQGHSHIYKLTLRSDADLGGQPIVDYVLTAELALQARPITGAQQIWISFRRPSFTTSNAQAAGPFEELAAELSKPMLANVTAGLVTQMHLDAEGSAMGVGIRRAVLAALQFPGSPTGRSLWTTVEHDGTGTFEARYQNNGSNSWSKTKVAYRSLTLPKGASVAKDVAPPEVKVVSSQGEVTVANGQLLQVTNKETLLTRPAPGAALTVSSQLELTFIGKQAFLQELPWEQTVARLQPVAPSESFVGRSLDGLATRARISNRSFKDVLAALERTSLQGPPAAGHVNEVPTDPQSRQPHETALRDRGSAFFALVALIEQDPATVSLIAAAVRRDSPATSILLDGLADAGSEAAQSALLAWLDGKSIGRQLRAHAAHSIIRVERPTEKVIEALTRLASDPTLATHAMYGLGTMARKLRESGAPQRAEAIGNFLLAQLGKARDTADLVRALRAVANSGHSPAFGAAERFSLHEEPAVRGAAVEAVRLMDAPAADALIARRLRDEPDANARLAVVNAAKPRERTPVLATALEHALVNDANPYVREAILILIARWQKAGGGFEASLQTMAANDPRPRLQALAQKALHEATAAN